MSKLLSSKLLLICLAIVALIGLLIVSYNATKNASSTAPASNATFSPKVAKMPTPVKDTAVAGQIIVKFKPQYSDAQINAHLQQFHASIIKTIEGINYKVIKVPSGEEDIVMHELQNDSYVETAQRDYTTHAFFVPNDPDLPLQYGLKNIGQSIQGKAGVANADIHIENAWDVTKGNGVKVAILDTGINLNQPDLAGKVILQKSFVSNTVEDGNGHGTHVAGILAADTNNSAGVAGTCPDCQLIIGKVLDDSGNGTTSNATAGITWAADNGAKVISMSLGTTDINTASLYAQAVNYAMSKGALVVAAAGNDSSSQINYPAAANGVVSVAATTNKDQKASYSNFGSWVQIAAPGDNILSTGPTHSFQLEPFGYNTSAPYYYLSGTSMATPYVSGVAALVATTQYGTSPQAIANRLYATADKIAGSGSSWKSGRVDAALAVGPAPTATLALQPTSITPTLYCVGGNGTPPCATIPPSGNPTTVPPISGGANPSPSVGIGSPAAGGGSGGGANPSVSPTPESSTNPSPAVSGVPSGGSNPGIPCNNGASSVVLAIQNISTGNFRYSGGKIHAKDADDHGGKDNDGHKKNKNKGSHGGWLSRFIAFLLQLLEQLLKWLLQLISQCTVPPSGGVTAPSPTQTPVLSVSPAPTISSAPSVSQSPSGNPAPTIFGTSPTPSTSVPSSTTGTTKQTNCASSPHTCGFPDATNTGPVGCKSYTAMSGTIKVTTNGATYNCVKLTDGAFDVYANNVSIENSIILGNNWWGVNLRGGYSGLKVLHNIITGDVGKGPDNGGEDYAVSSSGEVGYNNISEFGDAISDGEGNVHDNYVHDLQSYIPLCSGSPCSYYEHTDDVIADGNNKNPLIIRHNTLFNQMTTAKGASASIGLFADFGPVIDTTVDDNLIAGGAYALYPGGGPTSKNIVVTNNHFSTIFWPGSGYYGADASSYWHTGSGNTWSGNVWDDGANAGKTVNP